MSRQDHNQHDAELERLRARVIELESDRRDKKREQIRDIIIALVFTAGPFGFGVPVFYSCISWAVAWLAFIHLTLTLEYLSSVNIRSKVVGTLLATVALVWIVYGPIRTAATREKAMAVSGDLFASGDGENHSSDLPTLQIGDGGSKLQWAGKSGGPMISHETEDFADRVSLEMVNGRVQLSTTIRAKDGSLIVEIVKNHWTVSSSKAICWDKNYSSDRLEVKDGKGRVVLQVRVLPSIVQFQAEWDEEKGKSGGIFEDGRYSVKDGISPEFEYPRELFWGNLQN